MTAICIVLSVLLLLFLIALLPVSLTLKYRDEVALTASVWAIRFQLYPKKKKKVKISDYTLKKEKKRKKKALKKRLKAEKKLQNAKKRTAKKTTIKPKEKKSLLESLELIYELLTAFIGGIIKHVKIKTSKIRLTVASDDAAKTAMLYAAANNAVLLIVTFLDSCKKVKKLHSSDISVNAGFLEEKCSADIEISFSLRVWHLVKILFVSALKYVTHKSK